MVIAQARHQKEDHAQGIGDAAGDQQDEPRLGELLDQHRRGEHDQPAHQQIDAHAQGAEAFRPAQLEEDAAQRERPDDGEQRPAGRAAKIDQQEGRIGAGDQQIDGAVIQQLEGIFQAWVTDTVIERRGRIQHHQGQAVEADADDLPGVDFGSEAGHHDQHDHADEAHEGADAVAGAVQPFLQPGIESRRCGGVA